MLLITGATGHTGQFLLEELSHKDTKNKARCLVKEDSSNLDKLKAYDVEVCYGDIEDEDALRKAMDGVDTVVHIVNIKYSPLIARIAYEMKVRRIVLIHTTGMYSKFRAYAETYKNIEDTIFKDCKVDFVILRPTMIYGTIQDHNMHKLIEYIKTQKYFPIFGNGKGLMRPVHARDLAKAIALVLENTEIKNKGYDIPGGTVISYRDILFTIAKRVNPDIKFVFIPYSVSIALGVLYNAGMKMIGRKGQISIEQIKRLDENKNYSFDAAASDFGYSPISFDDGIEEEIKGMG